jgi:hypothetical protein
LECKAVIDNQRAMFGVPVGAARISIATDDFDNGGAGTDWDAWKPARDVA